MTVREIEHHLAMTIGVDLSAGTISAITDAVADAVLLWQNRSPEEFARSSTSMRSASKSAKNTEW